MQDEESYSEMSFQQETLITEPTLKPEQEVKKSFRMEPIQKQRQSVTHKPSPAKNSTS